MKAVGTMGELPAKGRKVPCDLSKVAFSHRALSRNVEESFRIFQGRILDEYEAMKEEMDFQVIDATLSIEEQQQQVRDIVQKKLGRSLQIKTPQGVERGKNGSEEPLTVL